MDILRGFTEYNKKMQCHVPTRFCLYNIAFFDLDKESEDAPWPPIHQIPQPLRNWLDDSVNVIAIRVAQSDRKGPISIYGTVLARDEYDYRCVYLFRRGRDDPQLITPKVCIVSNSFPKILWLPNSGQTLNIRSRERIPIFGCKLLLCCMHILYS